MMTTQPEKHIDKVGLYLLEKCDWTESRTPEELWARAESGIEDKGRLRRPRDLNEVAAALKSLRERRFVAARFGNDGRERWRRTTLLVVEDDPQVLNIFMRMISRLGYGVLGTIGAEAGLLTVLNEEIDLVLADVHLRGGLDGPGMVAKIRQARPEMRCIYVTASRRVGPLDSPVLYKPFDLDTLSSLVERMLGARREESDPAGA